MYKYAGNIEIYNMTRDDGWNENLLIICNQETLCFRKPKIGLDIKSNPKIYVINSIVESKIHDRNMWVSFSKAITSKIRTKKKLSKALLWWSTLLCFLLDFVWIGMKKSLTNTNYVERWWERQQQIWIWLNACVNKTKSGSSNNVLCEYLLT